MSMLVQKALSVSKTQEEAKNQNKQTGEVSRGGEAMMEMGLDVPIFTTLENCTDFSAAFWRSSIEKIFNPDSFIYTVRHHIN